MKLKKNLKVLKLSIQEQVIKFDQMPEDNMLVNEGSVIKLLLE